MVMHKALSAAFMAVMRVYFTACPVELQVVIKTVRAGVFKADSASVQLSFQLMAMMAFTLPQEIGHPLRSPAIRIEIEAKAITSQVEVATAHSGVVYGFTWGRIVGDFMRRFT